MYFPGISLKDIQNNLLLLLTSTILNLIIPPMKNNFPRITKFLLPVLLLSFLTYPGEARDLFYLQGKININTASRDKLNLLPFIGEKRAKEIISYREKKGAFSDTKELLSIPGIGTDTYLAVRKYLALSGITDLHYSKFSGFMGPAVFIDSVKGPINALKNEKYFFVLTEKLKQAKKNIMVCMYLFKTSKFSGNFANQIMNELIASSKRGIKVEVLMEENDRPKDKLNNYNHNTAKKLRNAGIKVRFDNKRIINHSKLIIIDERLVFIGSHNLTHTALSKSNETSLLVDSEELARVFLEYIHNME